MSSNLRDGIVECRVRGVDDERGMSHRFEFARFDFIPGWQAVAGDVAGAGFGAVTMACRVAAGDADVESAHAGAFGDIAPGVAGELDRVDRIRDHGLAHAQIVFGEGKGDAVALVIHGALVAGVQQRLFDRVDAQVNGADLARQGPRDRCFAGGRQAGQDDEGRCHS